MDAIRGGEVKVLRREEIVLGPEIDADHRREESGDQLKDIQIGIDGVEKTIDDAMNVNGIKEKETTGDDHLIEGGALTIAMTIGGAE